MTVCEARRQARCITDTMILPASVEPGRWYDIRPGRRSTDQQPGMVLLDVGSHRVLLPESCLEFRAAEPASSPASAPSRRAGAFVRTGARAVRTALTAHPIATVMSMVPLGAVAALLAERLAAGR